MILSKLRSLKSLDVFVELDKEKLTTDYRRYKEAKQRPKSVTGRLISIRHVLSSMPIQLLAAMAIPSQANKKIESLLSYFLGDFLIMAKDCIG